MIAALILALSGITALAFIGIRYGIMAAIGVFAVIASVVWMLE